jgi:enamine deaminase RidA (YjgF/YER057c/UK114 family)
LNVEQKRQECGLVLPEPLIVPQLRLPFAPVRIFGQRAYVSGHPPQAPDGSIVGPFGKVGGDLTVEEGYEAARLIGLAMVGSLQRELGDLDRITAWLRIFGMVNSADGFTLQPVVINGCSDLILDLFGPEIGKHARCAVGMAQLPLGIPVEIEAEVAFE